jgi:predicted flap endonuclease-1-like 5' DNA nuclease
MSESLASFRELKGIGPATEVRLHEAGVFTWEALSEVVEILSRLGTGTGETFRELAGQIEDRRSAAGAASPRRADGEHSEAFIVRLAVAADGRPVRSSLTHVRTQTEQPLAGWAPGELVRLIEEQAGLSGAEPAPPPEASGAEPPAPAPEPEPAAPAPEPEPAATAPPEHLVVLDAGRAIGGSSRTIELAVATNRLGDPASFEYRATLAGRPYGDTDGPWTDLASLEGRGRPPARLPVRFEAVDLPPGLQRLRLELALRLAEPRDQAPALALA